MHDPLAADLLRDPGAAAVQHLNRLVHVGAKARLGVPRRELGALLECLLDALGEIGH